MTISAEGPARTDLAGAVHEAVLYADPGELADGLATRLGGPIADGQRVVAVVDGTTRAVLRRALGPDADRVEFPDPAQVHRLPAFTVAQRWARLGHGVTTPGGRATIVGQHVTGLPEADAAHWARLDIALNVALVGLPVTVLCPYRDDGRELARVHATHHVLTTDAGLVASTSYRPPVEAVVEYPPPPPPDLGPPAAELRFAGAQLPDLRHATARVAERAGLDGARTADAVLAVNEIATNAAEHGPGTGRLRLWVDVEPGTPFAAEVTDDGRMDVPFPGMTAPRPSGARGRGLWLASELCDVLQVWSDGGGTVVRLRFDG